MAQKQGIYRYGRTSHCSCPCTAFCVNGLIQRRHLRSEEHTGGANELQFAAQHGHLRQEAVDVVNGEEERLAVQLVLLRHLDQPVDEDAAHAARDVRLSLHVQRLRLVLQLQEWMQIGSFSCM